MIDIGVNTGADLSSGGTAYLVSLNLCQPPLSGNGDNHEDHQPVTRQSWQRQPEGLRYCDGHTQLDILISTGQPILAASSGFHQHATLGPVPVRWAQLVPPFHISSACPLSLVRKEAIKRPLNSHRAAIDQPLLPQPEGRR